MVLGAGRRLGLVVQPGHPRDGCLRLMLLLLLLLVGVVVVGVWLGRTWRGPRGRWGLPGRSGPVSRRRDGLPGGRSVVGVSGRRMHPQVGPRVGRPRNVVGPHQGRRAGPPLRGLHGGSGQRDGGAAGGLEGPPVMGVGGVGPGEGVRVPAEGHRGGGSGVAGGRPRRHQVP